MAIELTQETRTHLITSLRRYASERLDTELDGLPAEMLLDFILREIGPSIYNRGVSDAQAWIVAQAADAEGVCFEPEFGYWDAAANGKVRRGRG